jgi:uncharacterized protein
MTVRFSNRIVALSAALALCACAGPSREHKLDLDARLGARDWDGAAAQIDAAREAEYGKRNAVLFLLDKASVLHAAERYQESDALLDEAERRLDELYTQSVSKAAGTFLVNDGADDYRGEPHERALLHVLRALNYVFLYRTDDAVVEARKVSAFLGELEDKVGVRGVYRDDAFARYLAALLFEDAGKDDDARISRAKAGDAYAWYATTYGVPTPALDGDAPPEFGEVVLFHYNGKAPRRESHTIQVAWNEAVAAVAESGEKNAQVENAVRAGLFKDAITVAFPKQVQDAYLVRGSDLVVEGQRVSTVLVEDVGAIAAKALDDRLAAIRARAIARATIKFILAKGVEKAAEQKGGALVGLLAGVASRAVAAATEVADTRCWATLPAEIRMARVRLPPGLHTLDIEYTDSRGAVYLKEKIEVEVLPARRTYLHVKTSL